MKQRFSRITRRFERLIISLPIKIITILEACLAGNEKFVSYDYRDLAEKPKFPNTL